LERLTMAGDALQQILAAVQQLHQGQQPLQQLQEQVMQGQQHALQHAARIEERFSVRLANHIRSSRDVLVPMPDANGALPPANLIPDTAVEIAALPEEQLTQALNFYGLAVSDSNPDRIMRLLTHLGVGCAV
jgi:hypothetical protein